MTDIKTVYFVRHGESEDNAHPVFQATDSPLSAKGREQAAKIAERASKLNYEALISSPLPRASQTAEAVAKRTGHQPEYSDLFVERKKPTSIEGKPYTDEAANKIWREYDKSLYDPTFRVEDSENYADHVARADKALEFLRLRPETSLLVVTHGYFLRTMLMRVLLGDGLTPEHAKNIHRVVGMQNTGLTVLRYHDAFEDAPAWRLWIYNDHAHLAD